MKCHLWNMFAAIKNGQVAKKFIIRQKRKKICESLLKIMWDEGFIQGYRVSKTNKNTLEIFLKYDLSGIPAVNCINSISKPGKRVFYSARKTWKIDSSKAFVIFSTEKGLKSIKQAKKEYLGGEPLLIIK